MPGVLRSILVGGASGLGLGAAITFGTILSPALGPLARGIRRGYLQAAAQAHRKAPGPGAGGPGAPLGDLHEKATAKRRESGSTRSGEVAP
jgi:hypothetical protein